LEREFVNADAADDIGFARHLRAVWREDAAAKFLDEMDQIMPWAQLESLIEPNYPKEGNATALAENHTTPFRLPGPTG
jgi:hypothetical protein